ncbi:putative transmembrane protein 244 [Ruditapes philippinarum]|uniref:putative transmembrane protein 244 n=1 Tax=Ruditapes philippinarum TaxID=129788 RepID=UPI00295C1790|nr:putative transmembrane protein 244 [Ruditapes philippinarum]
MPSSKRILLYIFTSQVLFYSAYYCVGSILFAIYSLDEFDGTIPFNFRQWIEFTDCCNFTKTETVNALSMVITYPIAGALTGAYLPERVWDYSITIAVIHIAMSFLVMLDIASNWSWWVCLGISLVLMIGCGEGVLALKRYRNKSRLVVPEPETEPRSYLYR